MFVWVNLEDIIDFNVHFELVKDGYGGMGFKFIGKGRLIVKKRPLHFTGYNYEEYCQVKNILVKLLKFEWQEIDNNEDMKNHLLVMATHPGIHDNKTGYGSLQPFNYFYN